MIFRIHDNAYAVGQRQAVISDGNPMDSAPCGDEKGFCRIPCIPDVIRTGAFHDDCAQGYNSHHKNSGGQRHGNGPTRIAWVRLKCQFGCGGYNSSYCCPPHTPTAEATRQVLDCYKRALLFHIETVPSEDRGKRLNKFYQMLVELEGELFKDGYYKAFVYLAGPCRLCKECGKTKGNSCHHAGRARPSMESCGIDVFQTARNNDCHIETLREETEPRNTFCLMLVD